MESANKLGLTSYTSLPCQWKVPAATKVVPTKIKYLTIRKSQHGQEKTRPLVSNLKKTQFKPLESLNIDRNTFIDELRKAVPNACLLKGTDTPVPEVLSLENSQELGQQACEVEAYWYCLNNITSGHQTVEDFIDHQLLTENEVNLIEEKTVGQSSNSLWHDLRKGRITASNFYAVHTRMNSLKKNPEVDMSSIVSVIMGESTPNSNIKALKFGRESEPLAKTIYCNIF